MWRPLCSPPLTMEPRQLPWFCHGGKVIIHVCGRTANNGRTTHRETRPWSLGRYYKAAMVNLPWSSDLILPMPAPRPI